VIRKQQHLNFECFIVRGADITEAAAAAAAAAAFNQWFCSSHQLIR